MMVNARFVARLRVPLSFAVRILLVACLLLSVTASTIAAAPPPTNAGAAQGPLEPAARYLVVENVGQFAAEARFLVKQGDQRIWLTDDALWLTVPDPVAAGAQTESAAAGARSGTALRFTFQGANPGATLEPFDRVPTHVSYLIGNDPSRWQRDVPVWSGVRYRNLYPGVDLVIGGDAAGAVPWRLEAGPGANLQAVTLRVEGAETVAAEAGQLRLGMKGRAVDVALPAWSVAGQANPVGSTVVQQGGDGAFTVAPGAEPEPGQAPAAGTAGVADVTDLIYSTYLGGTAGDSGSAIAVDYLGNAYVTGATESDPFPVKIGSSYGGATDAFVAKFNATGTALLYATYLGGTDLDVGAGIAVSGDLAYVVGETKSTDFPGMTGTVVGSDIFVVALNAAGSDVRYVARLGGGDFDTGYGIAVAGTEAYVVGNTFSTDIPNATGCTIANSSAGDLVVAKLNTLGVPVYTTCLGGSGFDAGYAIAVLNGEAYVTGQSWSTDFPDGLLTGPNDILVARFDANGVRDASALIGGPDEDLGWSIAVDGSDHVYIAGTTTIASAPPLPPSWAGAWGGGSSDAVVLKLESTLTTDFATFLGGSGEDSGYAIAVDTVQALYVAGTTTSTDFPTSTGAYSDTLSGANDAFVARLHLESIAANKVTYATYLGETVAGYGCGVATDTGGNAFVTGTTGSGDFPTSTDAFNINFGGVNDAFATKLKVSSPPGVPVVTIAASGANADLSWGLVVPSADDYQVLRSSAPYFKPNDWSVSTLLPEPTGRSFSDTGALTSVNAYFYVVKAISEAPSAAGASSNEVGKFTFQLVPGN